jgi:hypothetical protein
MGSSSLALRCTDRSISINSEQEMIALDMQKRPRQLISVGRLPSAGPSTPDTGPWAAWDLERHYAEGSNARFFSLTGVSGLLQGYFHGTHVAGWLAGQAGFPLVANAD